MGGAGERSDAWTLAEADDLLQQVNQGVLVLDAADRVVFASAVVADKLGLPQPDLVGRPFLEVLPDADGTPITDAIARARRDRTRVSGRSYLRSLEAWLQVDARPRSDGAAVLFVGDVTAEVRIDQQRTLRSRLAGLSGGNSFEEDVAQMTATIRRTIGYPVGEAWVSTRPGAPMRMVAVDHDDRPDLHRLVARSRAVTLSPELPADGSSTTGGAGIGLVPDVWQLPRFVEIHGGDDLRVRSMFRFPVELGEGASLRFTFLSDRRLDDDLWPGIVADEATLIRVWLAGRWARHELDRFVAVSQELLWSVGPDDRFQRVNPRMVAAFGYRVDEVVGRSFVELLHPDDVERAAAASADLLGGGPPVLGFEVRFRTADGGYRLTSWNALANPHEDTIYASGRDITDERRTEVQREVRNAVLESIASSAPLEATLQLLCASVEAQVDGALTSVMRYDPDAGSLHPVVGASLPTEYLAALDGMAVGPVAGSCGTAVHRRAPVLVADLETDPLWQQNRALAGRFGLRSCWSVPITDGAGTALGTFAIYRRRPGLPSTTELEVVGDAVQLATIAIERDRTERLLAANEERLRLLTGVTTDVVFDWDIASDAVWTSSARTPFDALADIQTGRAGAFRDRIHPDDRARFVEHVAGAVEGTGPDIIAAEFRYQRPDGTYADTSLTAAVIRDESGRAERVVGGMTDVTDRRDLERQVLRVQRMETIGALAGGIAHDLNNTLAPILMAVDLVRRQALAGDVQASIDTIEASARRGAAMVGQLLSFARGADGERVPVDPATLVREVEAIVRDSFPKGIVVETAVAEDLPSFLGDATQMHQVLMNLAVNARDAMPDGGRLRITAATTRIGGSGATGVDHLAPGEYVVLEVSDTGTGILPADRERIFEPFFTTKPAPEGTGLGLSTSAAIVRNHGGAIGLRTEPGRGSTFTVLVPATGATAADATAPVQRPPAGGRGEVVLLVDDEPSIRSVAGRLLEVAGYQVVTAAHGGEALAVIDERRSRGEPVDLVVTDWMMPVLDGTGLLRALRERDHRPPVIVISGLVDQAGSEHLGQAGVHAVLVKPFDADSLLDEVHRALRLGGRAAR